MQPAKKWTQKLLGKQAIECDSCINGVHLNCVVVIITFRETPKSEKKKKKRKRKRERDEADESMATEEGEVLDTTGGDPAEADSATPTPKKKKKKSKK